VKPIDVLVGAVFAGVVAFLAYRGRALTRGGAVAAFVVGTVTYAAGQWAFTAILLAFFLPSVALSRAGKARKRGLVDVGKSGPRDAMQVLANGGIATVCALLYGVTHDPRWAWAFGGAYAAAAADTWGTEIGTLVRRRPRSILTLRPIPTGMSGGVTIAGTLAEIAGAVWVGLVAVVCLTFHFVPNVLNSRFGPWPLTPYDVQALISFPVAGVAGATLDSILGATVQELLFCDACGRTCETDPHACGRPARLVRGLRGATNDVVNLLATAAGALIAVAIAAA
jgi:uncharacterized protein (TIGR00297 family)